MEKGLLHVYYGDGKGKTTAAAGLAARAAGSGMKVLFCRFLKGVDSAEVPSLEKLGVEVRSINLGERFSWTLSEGERADLSDGMRTFLERAFSDCAAGGYDMLALDEGLDAAGLGFVDENRLISLINDRPSGLEVVLTGRNPSFALLEAADYATELVLRKHPYYKGISARRGIEY